MGGIQHMGIFVVNDMSKEDLEDLAQVHRAASRADYVQAEKSQEQSVQDITAPQPTPPTRG